MLEQLLEWDERLAAGDHSFDRNAIALLRAADPADDDPVLFHAPQSAAAVQLARKAGVDFAVRRPDGATVLFETDLYAPQVFAIVAQDLSARGAVDWTDTEGLTALSAQVKNGQVENARTLLEHGASPNTFAQVARYGGAHLTIAMQAVNVVTDIECHESVSISLLRLLRKFGLRITAEHKAHLLDRAQSKPKLKEFIETSL